VQGKTALTLTVTEDMNGMNAIFAFAPHTLNPSVPMGSFMMKGGVNPRTGAVEFKPVHWIQQPVGYGTVGLSGKLKNNRFAGKITGAPGCKGFELVRGAAVVIQPTLGIGIPSVTFKVDARMQAAESTPAFAPTPAPAPTPKPVKKETCKSVLLAKGHSAASLIHCDGAARVCAVALLKAGHSPASLVHCGSDVVPACGVALLEAGHSPASLVHCQDVSDVDCAVTILGSGKSPAQIVHCD